MSPASAAGLWLLLGAALGAFGTLAWCARSFRDRRRRYGRLLSFVSHEINTPLTSVNMTVLNFLQGVFGPVPPEHQEWMGILREQSARMAVLVGDLRDLIHLEFHRDLIIFPEAVETKRLIEEVVGSMEGSVSRGGAPVAVSLPAAPPPLWGDRDKLQRMIAGLLAHAKKFRSGGPISLGVRAVDGGGSEVVVAYAGPRLSASEARAMLDLFFPAEQPQSAVLACVGLGLGFTRLLARMHGGELRLEAAPEGQTRLLLTLPAPPAATT